MRIANRLRPATLVFDRDETLTPAAVSLGLVEVTTNSSSARIITFPSNSALTSSEHFSSGELHDVIVWNKGAQDLQLAADSAGADFLVGDPVVHADGFRLVKLAVGYSSGVTGIFCV